MFVPRCCATAARAVLSVALLCLASLASATPLVLSLDENTTLPPDLAAAAVVRDLPGLRLVLLPETTRLPTSLESARLHSAPGEEFFLVDTGHHADLGLLALESTVVAQGEDLALVSIPTDHARRLDRLGVCKERLTWVPRQPRAAGPSTSRRLAKASPQVKQAIVDAVDQVRFSQIVRELSGDLAFTIGASAPMTISSRYSHTAGTGAGVDRAADYLEDRFQAAGYPVIRQAFNVGTTTTTENIIAVKTGTVYPDSVVVVGAHYDSISEIPLAQAPGAEDNGSGTAAVLHLAEIFANYSTERTIHFVCFSGEEEGLYGSYYYVNQLNANGWHVTQSLIMDMIASYVSNFKVIIEGQPAWVGLMNTFESNVTQYAQIGSRQDLVSWGSDHVPFQSAGIPCFLAIDWDWGSYSHYHNSSDLWAYVAPTLGVRITQAIGATLADLSNPSDSVTTTPPSTSTLALEQNLPNPFNPSTRIFYNVPRAGRVRIEVFDVSGRRVASLLDEVQPSGRRFVDWNGEDAEGRRVASGLYLYRLSHPEGSLARRMVLAK